MNTKKLKFKRLNRYQVEDVVLIVLLALVVVGIAVVLNQDSDIVPSGEVKSSLSADEGAGAE